jgi:flagellar motility protein MotE (MotC chaperone)
MGTTNPARRERRKVVQVIVALLLASAVLRALTEAGPAIAEMTTLAPMEGDAPDQPLDDGFLAALRTREADVAAREAALLERLAMMRAAEAEFEEKRTALQAAEDSLLATISMAESASATDIAQLTAVYENMKPKEAAALFEEMSPEFAAGFLALMRPDAAAAIMTEVAPETAYAFSVVLAGRNAGVPTE